MDLNDPFGRRRTQEEAAFEDLRRKLAEAGITDREGIDEVLRRSRRRIAIFAVVVVLLATLLSLLLPALALVFGAAAVLGLAIAAKAALQGQRLLRRCREGASARTGAPGQAD